MPAERAGVEDVGRQPDGLRLKLCVAKLSQLPAADGRPRLPLNKSFKVASEADLCFSAR